MKLVLCKPNEKPQIVELSKNHDYKDIMKLLEIDTPISCVKRKIGDEYFDFWIDDEGMLKDDKHITAYCGGLEVIVGNIVIATHTSMGETRGLTKKQLDKVLDKSNWVNNELFLNMFIEELNDDYDIVEEIDENGDAVIIEDYKEYGNVKMNRNGGMLKYGL